MSEEISRNVLTMFVNGATKKSIAKKYRLSVSEVKSLLLESAKKINLSLLVEGNVGVKVAPERPLNELAEPIYLGDGEPRQNLDEFYAMGGPAA